MTAARFSPGCFLFYTMNADLKTLLDREVLRYNCPEFIDDDPVQFPRLYSDKRDIEIAALLVSTIAWGNRTMICRSAARMLDLLGHQPYHFMMDCGYEELPQANLHRTFFNSNLCHYLRGLRSIYAEYGSLEDFAAAVGAGRAESPAWHLAAAISERLTAANDGVADSRCLPGNIDKTALKRFNMALRWLVRDDGIVDLGVWTVIRPNQLRIPLDVHVGNVSRALGLLERRQNDRRAVEELTAQLRRFCPDDPVKYDFALFGAGVSARVAEITKG